MSENHRLILEKDGIVELIDQYVSNQEAGELIKNHISSLENKAICIKEIRESNGTLRAIEGKVYEIKYDLKEGSPYFINELNGRNYFGKSFGKERFKEVF